MAKKDIISKLKESGLAGRGGGGFPTGVKWEMVKKAVATKKYIVCNASEGEPNVFKDGFILQNYPQELVEGIKIALETIDNSSAYIYLRPDYYEKFKKKLEKLTKGLPVKLFKKKGGYIAGEETVALESIEGKRMYPRARPPFPPQSGLWGCPTLVNNVETFYYVAKVDKGEYKKTRLYSISGDVKNKGVYEFPENYTIKRVLKETKNLPNFDFFVQSGGGSCGGILLPSELEQKVEGTGAIIVYNREKTDVLELMEKWAEFFLEGNCGKCVPCREGVFRLVKMIKSGKIDEQVLEDILLTMENTSFCALGKGIALPFGSLIKKIK